MPTLLACSGFEHGSTAGWATGSAGNKIYDAIVGTPTIVTTSPRTGTYCLEISASAATEGIRWGTDTLGTSKTHLVSVVYVYFPTSLPSGDFDLIQFQCVGPNYVLRFRSSDSKLCVGIPGGAEQAGPVVTTNTWYRLDVHMDVSANPNTIDWRVDGTTQTQFSNAVAADTLSSMDLGPTLAAQTGTVRFDDWCASTTAGDYPLGATKVTLLKPDTGGALDTSTITTSEWNTFAGATPTLTAWNATTALAAIDEVPVGLGASADGFCRITGTDADKVGIPFTTYTLAAGESVAGLRMLACCWAQSGTTCTHSFHSYNGTTETALLAAADVGTDNSSSAPAWVAKMCTLADFNTQGELDALQIRFGSTDSTPDAGIHAVYVEVAVTEAAGATVTPAVIAASTSASRADINTVAGPALTATVTAMNRPDANVVAGPVVTAAITALPQPAVDVVAGPAVIPNVVALPQATPVIGGGDVTASPLVLAATAALARADINAAAGPSVLTALTALTQASVNVVAGPSVLASITALPRPLVDVNAGPAAVAALAALAQASVNTAAGPAVFAMPTAVPGPLVGVTLSPVVLAATAAMVQAALNVAAGPAAAAIVVALPVPTVIAGGNVTALPATVSAVVAMTRAALDINTQPAVVAVVAVLPSVGLDIAAGPVGILTLVAVGSVVAGSAAAPAVADITHRAGPQHTAHHFGPQYATHHSGPQTTTSYRG